MPRSSFGSARPLRTPGTVLALALTLGAARPAGAQDHALAGDRVITTALSGDITIGDARRVAHVRLVRGGSVDGNISVAGRSTLRAEGGRVTGALSCAGQAKAVVSGATFGGALYATDGGAVVLSGGASGDSASAYGHGTVTVVGGEVGGDLNAYERGTVNLRGGRVRNSIDAEQRGTVNVWGTGLRVAHDLGGGGQYTLSGRLADGTPLDGTPLLISNATGVRIVLHDTISGRAAVLEFPGPGGSRPASTRLALAGVLAAVAVLAGLMMVTRVSAAGQAAPGVRTGPGYHESHPGFLVKPGEHRPVGTRHKPSSRWHLIGNKRASPGRA